MDSTVKTSKREPCILAVGFVALVVGGCSNYVRQDGIGERTANPEHGVSEAHQQEGREAISSVNRQGSLAHRSDTGPAQAVPEFARPYAGELSDGSVGVRLYLCVKGAESIDQEEATGCPHRPVPGVRITLEAQHIESGDEAALLSGTTNDGGMVEGVISRIDFLSTRGAFMLRIRSGEGRHVVEELATLRERLRTGDNAKKERFGDRAWIADYMERRYVQTEKTYGENYKRVAVTIRESELINEIGTVACLLELHSATDTKGRESRANAVEHCGKGGAGNLGSVAALVRAYRRSPMFVQRLGATPLAVMPVEDVRVVVATALEEAALQDGSDLFLSMVVPQLHAQCVANGVCKVFGIN